MVELVSQGALVEIDPSCGGRVARLEVDGHCLVVNRSAQGGSPSASFEWGIFPMVPFAGRVRHGRFIHEDRIHQMPLRMPPHAIHGVVDDVNWRVVERDSVSVLLHCVLDSPWPFLGEVTHHIELLRSSLRMELSLTAHESMPAQVGWHPWFVRPALVNAAFAEWLPKDADGMPTKETREGMPDLAGPVDDCFTSIDGSIRVDLAGQQLSLASDCSHWVVYTGSSHGVCVEPQSGPPNEFESNPRVLKSGETLSRWFEIAW